MQSPPRRSGRTAWHAQLVSLRVRAGSCGVQGVQFDATQEYLQGMWNGSYELEGRRVPVTDHTRALMRRFLTHMAVSNTISPVLDEATQKV
jgi:hypothetical protein